VQNCNSLNISTVCSRQLAKICAITALCTDIIFLSDIRLNSNPEHIEKIKKLFLYNTSHSYDAYFNSSKNCRGVGILISKKLSYTVEKCYKDLDENILGLVLKINDVSIRVFSIYGPNHDDIGFYNRLDEFLKDDPLLSAADPFRALHPSAKDYTFSPAGARTNRSRLDFFLICDEFIPRVSKCSISESLKSKFFDHKPVTLDFSRNKTRSKPFINRTIINNPRTEDIVLAAAMDTYFNHVDIEDPHNHAVLGNLNVHQAEGANRLQQEKEKVGHFLLLITQFNSLNEQLSLDPSNNLIALEVAAKNTEISIARENLLNWDTVTQLKLSTGSDTFLEVLMGNVKGNVISFQQWVRKTENSLKSRLVKRLNDLKLNYEQNCNEISAIEDQLTGIVDKELIEKAKTMRLFESINAEKPTPIFMSLARCRSTSKKLSSIKQDDGSPYNSREQQIEGIVSYYEKLYKKPVNERINYEGCIEEFLGPDIVNSTLVQGSLLTVNERNELDRPLTIDEIDKSMEKANFKSAPGIDGISNTFLKKYWRYFRHALYNFAVCCYEKNCLTANFLSASIKLIPKKGDIENLKNWRPISLLSNMYKIISRAINTRLNKIVNRVCSRAQKGFNDCRYTQEVLINVLETIRHCSHNNISGALVAVDMAKAFDTLSHGYLTEVFKFFNFGPGIIKWLNLLGTKRTACIILDDGSYSRNFSLERGRAQGDNISPNTFDFGDQILIFRIELDPQVASVWQHFQAPHNRLQMDDPALINQDPANQFENESRRETDKNESLADDNSTLTLMANCNLQALRRILEDFADLSGLQCNYDKTCVLPLGPPVPGVDLAGFSLTDKIKLLGMEITPALDNIDEIFTTVHEKILDLISFWDRFRLTLPGRISVFKNLLVPQINYLGCILCPSERVLNRIQDSLDGFVLGNLTVSKDRRYLPPANGGLGIFNLKIFLDAQRCSWIKRAASKNIDNWRYDLKCLSPAGDITLIRKIDVDPFANPILTNIVSSYETFLPAFTLKEKNYKKGQIFLNPAFVRSGTDNNLLDIPFFTQAIYDRSKNNIRSLTFEKCFIDGAFRTKAQFLDIGIYLNDTVHLRLQSAMIFAKRKYSPKDSAKKCKSVAEFLSGFKKGSKKFRNVIMSTIIDENDIADLRTVNTYSAITDTNVNSNEAISFAIGMWNCSFLSNDFREFLFKERNNCLGLNSRVAHFMADVTDQCSQCRILNPGTANRETFGHLFLDCPVTRTVLNGFLRLAGNVIQGNNPDLKNIYWYGLVNGTLNKNVGLTFAIFRFVIWKFKIRKRVPRTLETFELVNTILCTICKVKPKIGLSFRNSLMFPNLLQARG